MQPPEVILENAEAVYDYYLDHRQNRLQAQAAYAILAARYRPRLQYAPGAEQRIRELVSSGTRLLVTINHLTQRDPYTVAGLAWRSPLRPAIGRTRVLAKDDLFVDPKQRRRVDMMGSIPVFRGKDHGLRAINAAGQRMMDVCAQRMQRGDDLAVFPEGTCNDVDPQTVQAVGSGIGHIASRAVKLGVRPAILAVGLSYGPGVPTEPSRDAVRGASCYLDMPVLDLPARPMEITRLVRERMQYALDEAVARY